MRWPGCTIFTLCLSISILHVRAQFETNNNCETPVMTYEGKVCVFPFVYRGITYTSCTNVNHDRPWCAYNTNYVQGQWGNCLVQTVNGGHCTFPFTYNGIRYEQCTRVASSAPWCGYTSIYESGSSFWGHCALPPDGCPVTPMEPPCMMLTYGGTSNGAPCSLPFLYKGNNYVTCIKTNPNSKAWCSTTRAYEAYKQWGYCTDEDVRAYTISGDECIFPFSYAGRDYYGCTTDFSSSGRGWCATTSRLAEGSDSWGHCNLELKCQAGAEINIPENCYISTTGGNANRAPCVFPFQYQGNLFGECTTRNNDGLPWCATTSNYDNDGRWGNCAQQLCEGPGGNTGCSGFTVGGNAGGASCHFPFEYRGSIYYQCTTIRNSGVEWCATTASYDMDKLWGNCVDSDCVPGTGLVTALPPEPACAEYTEGGNARGARCVFPFEYKNQVYYQCTTLNNNNVRWCATTSDYDEDRKWGNCIGCDLGLFECPVRTTGGSANGANCVFPFIYKGVAYRECTSMNWDRPWCATVTYYDKNNWGNCIIFTEDNMECTFPFKYNGKTYHECTEDFQPRPWCATTNILDHFGTGMWGFCQLDPMDPCPNVPTAAPVITPSTAELPLTPTTFSGVEPTPAVTPAPGCQDTFDRFDNTLSYGGVKLDNVGTTTSMCLNECRSRVDCEAVDFDRNQMRCYIHVDGYLSNVNNNNVRNVDQYRRNRIC